MMISNIQVENKRVHNYFQTPYFIGVNTGRRPVSAAPASISKLKQDIFIRTKSPENVSFSGDFTYISKTFENKFTKSFFKKLMAEKLPCAYTGIEMISRSDYEALKEMQVLQKRSPVAVKYLKKFKNNMIGIEKEVFNYLEMESKKHPDLKLQELLQLKYTSAEKTLITQQSNVLNKINLIARNLSKEEYLNVRKVVQSSFDKIFAQAPLPEERFSRKAFIYHLKHLSISDKKAKENMLKTAEKLPQSCNSFNAFVVKYSQPYKIHYNGSTPIRLPRDSEELGLRLLEPMIATDEHIYPQELYKMEEQARLKGDKKAKELSDFKVTILTSKFINNEKGNMLLDDFIKKSKFNLKENIQEHVNRLIRLSEVWMKKGRIADSALLTDYIQVLKGEFDMRSKLLNIDISDLDKYLPDIQAAYDKHMAKMGETKLNKVQCRKSIKRPDCAENSHKEHYMGSDGKIMENRKRQRHTSRFSN